MNEWPDLGRDHPSVMAEGRFDYGYALAAEYFPGLERDDFYSYACDYTLAIAEWESIVGAGDPRREDVERFYRDGFGLLFNLLRHPRPPGVWDADEDRGNITRRYLNAAGARSIIDFGGGIGGMALHLARCGYQVGFVDAGETARFGEWWIEREGLAAMSRAPGKVICYATLGAAVLNGHWHAISALDVLEHVWEPVELLRAFYNALAPGGVLVLTRHSFKAHPTHLSRTFWLFDDLDRVLGEVGFMPLVPPDGHYGIAAWRKAGELPPLPVQEQPETPSPAAPADEGGTETGPS